VPEVVLAQHRLIRLDPPAVELVAGEDGAWIPLPENAVPARMVDVGVADQHEIRLHTEAVEVRDDDVGRCRGDAGVDEHASLRADEEVLAHEAWPEVGLDAVDAGRDLAHRLQIARTPIII
jgi:hypothetical protein